MASQDDVISRIENRQERLIRFAETLIEENTALKQQIDGLTEQLSEKDDKVRVLESKYQNLMLAKAMSNSSKDVKDMQQQINRMVREIDKCIALLNN